MITRCGSVGISGERVDIVIHGKGLCDLSKINYHICLLELQSDSKRWTQIHMAVLVLSIFSQLHRLLVTADVPSSLILVSLLICTYLYN
jgi:hypothetical protein